MKKRRKGKRGRGPPRHAPHCRLAGAWEDDRDVQAPTKGATASPLDGGVLTRVGSARAGEGADNGAMFSPFFAQSSLAAATLRKKESGKERGREATNALGFQVGRHAGGFV